MSKCTGMSPQLQCIYEEEYNGVCRAVDDNVCSKCGYFSCKCRSVEKRKHSHYFKDVKNLEVIDIYRVLELFNVSNPCLQHAIKKLLVAGGGRGTKDITIDVQEAIDTLLRWREMKDENRT